MNVSARCARTWCSVGWQGVRPSFVRGMAIAALAAVGCFVRLGDAPLGFDDVFYAQKAREMVRAGDWFFLNPTHGGALSIDNKPPMLFWALGVMGILFGFHDWTMRLVPALCGYLLVWLVYFGVRRAMGEYTGFIAAFVLAFTQQFLQYARSATMETMYALWICAGLLCLLQARSGDGRWYVGMWVAFALAAMTRQAMVVIPVVGLVIYLMVRRDDRPLHSPWMFAGFIVWCVVVLPWHVAMLLRHGEHFVRSYLGVAFRYGVAGASPWDEYLRKLVENYWPWLPFLLKGMWRSVSRVRTYGVRGREADGDVFLLASILTPLILLQCARFRAPQYLFALYPLFAVVVARVLTDWDRRQVFWRWLVGAGTVLASVWVLTPILPQTLDSREHRDTAALAPSIRQVAGRMVTPAGPDAWHFINGVQYYADVSLEVRTWEEIRSLVSTGESVYLIARERDLHQHSEVAACAEMHTRAYGSALVRLPKRIP